MVKTMMKWQPCMVKFLSQFNRYMGHVTANIGGVYEYYKTSDQEGAVYTHCSQITSEKCVKFHQQRAFFYSNMDD